MNNIVKYLARLFFSVVVIVVILKLSFPLPDISKRPYYSAQPSDPNTLLGTLFTRASVVHPGQTGIMPLYSGTDAFGSRFHLVEKAQQSIDIQYYIWNNDVSGRLLLKALYDAAMRGVKVRLLLDDTGISGLDETLTALNTLENFEVRVFNPSMIRIPKFLGYSFDALRMNRRMHNKAFIVDGSVVIIGGRNIGDEYFQVGDKTFFIDLDVIGVGDIVPKTAASFDEYWNSQSVFEIESFIKSTGKLSKFLNHVVQTSTKPEAIALNQAIQNSARLLLSEHAALEWTKVELAYDDPIKGTGKARREQLLIDRIAKIIGTVQNKLDLVSAYFIPGKEGEAYFSNLAIDGKKVRILTNSINSTDVLMVHSGYSKYRRKLLESGVNLFELKLNDNTKQLKLFSSTLNTSNASLHAKTYAVDDNRILIGSFNFDPRSIHLNCEMIVLIHSDTLAKELSASFDGSIRENAYQTKLTPKGKMVWNEVKEDGELVIYQEEPNASWFQQVAIIIIGWLPIEWLL